MLFSLIVDSLPDHQQVFLRRPICCLRVWHRLNVVLVLWKNYDIWKMAIPKTISWFHLPSRLTAKFHRSTSFSFQRWVHWKLMMPNRWLLFGFLGVFHVLVQIRSFHSHKRQRQQQHTHRLHHLFWLHAHLIQQSTHLIDSQYHIKTQKIQFDILSEHCFFSSRRLWI